MKKQSFFRVIQQDFIMIRGLIILNLVLAAMWVGSVLLEGAFEPEGNPLQKSTVACFSGNAPMFMDRAVGDIKVSDDKKSISFMSEDRKVKVSILNGTCLILPDQAQN